MNLQLAFRAAGAAALATGFAMFCFPVSIAQTSPVTTPYATTSDPLTGIVATSDANYWSVSQGDSLCGKKGDSCGSIYQILGGTAGNASRNYIFPGSTFPVPKGNYPIGLIEGPDENLYGTTAYGGTVPASGSICSYGQGCGVFFQLSPDSGGILGEGFLNYSVLHNFTTAEGGQGGPIILGSDGNYDGNVAQATNNGNASIYNLAPSGEFTLLFNFLAQGIPPQDGYDPSGLVEGDDGNFYGTTIASGGAGGVGVQDGAVFRLTPEGDLTVIAIFPSDGSLGAGPSGQMVEGPDGAFYGTTDGYAYTGLSVAPTIFRVTKAGDLSVLHTLSGTEGLLYLSPLFLGSDGKFYGVAAWGGDPTNCSPYGGCGTLFSVTTTGTFQVLYNFEGGATGAFPNAVIQDSNGNLVGVTGGYGPAGSAAGVVFKTTFPTGAETGPIQITLFKQSDMSPVTSSTLLDPNTPLVLEWNVSNAYSNTMRQCFAFFRGDNTNLVQNVYTEPDWNGRQYGTPSSLGYSGQTVVTPAYAGHYSYRLTCGGVETGIAAFLTVQNSIAISTISLADATVGQSYSQTLTATGGTAPYTWSIISGTLPPGLSLDGPSGTISGKPKQFGTYPLIFQVTDSSATPETATVSLTMTVSSGLTVTPVTLPQGVLGTAYSQTLSVTNGLAPYTLTIPANTLPAGLSFNAATATISGTPTKLGTSTFTVTVTDAENPQATTTQSCTLTIVSSLLTFTAAVLPKAGVSQAFSQQFAATGGVTPYIWSVSSGTLPQGLQLSSTGVLSGTPVQNGAGSPFTIQVTDTETPAQTATATFTLPVANTLTITTTTLPTATMGVPYSAPVNATGGLPPYTWTAGANLPTLGLSINPSTGVISGIPVVSETYTGGVGVTDSEGNPATVTGSVTITIQTPPAAVSSTSLAVSNANAAVGESVTFTAKVSSSAGTPTGVVTFAAGTNTIGTATLNASGVATLTTSFSTVGVYNVIASYGGDAGDQASASTPLTETIVAPSVSAAFSPSSITINPGASGIIAITVTPTGGYTGTVTFSCGTLPARVSCTFAPPSLTFAAGGGAQTDTLTVNTAASTNAMVVSPMNSGGSRSVFLAMLLWLPGSLGALAGVFRRNLKRRLASRLLIIAIIWSGLAAVGVCTGCGGSSSDAQAGTYSIPVTITLANGNTQTISATVTVQ